MRSELAIIQMFHSKLGIIFTAKLDNTRAIFEHIGVTYITCLSHVILQILPTATRWHPFNKHSEVGAFGRRAGFSSDVG